ncbi:MAG: hypothetical protein HUU20_06445 [Pirellulales bacterium]|nr:hypothetical protein [Pirellulales bacterium]
MGSSLTPYAVDLGKIKALVGSKNQRRLNQLIKRFGKGAEDNEGYGATWAELLRHLVLGGPYDEQSGPKYGCILQFLCMQFGQELSNDNFCDLRGAHGWFESLDEQLERAGVSTKLLSISKHLADRGSPIPIPAYNDFPRIGYLTAQGVARALDALLGAKLDDIGDEEDEDEELWLPEEFEEIRSWLETCVETKCDLVCFYS